MKISEKPVVGTPRFNAYEYGIFNILNIFSNRLKTSQHAWCCSQTLLFVFFFYSDLVATLCALSKFFARNWTNQKNLDFRTRTTTTSQVLTLSKRNPHLTIITGVQSHVELLYGHIESVFVEIGGCYSY